MSSERGRVPLRFRQLGRAELDAIAELDLDADQVDRYLGPMADIIVAVKRGPAHVAVGLYSRDELVGFYVLHPDTRDNACWWLGWLAIAPRYQGRGVGRQALRSAMRRLSGTVNCRRTRLLVAPDNDGARTLYASAGFREVGLLVSSGELILQFMQQCVQCAQAFCGNAAPAVKRIATQFRHTGYGSGLMSSLPPNPVHDPPVAE